MSQVKDDFALNCGFQHQGGATCTTAPAVLETKFQFSDTHPGSSFLGLFLAKRILSLGGQLSTPWVQLIFSVPQNKKGEQNIRLLKSECQGKKEAWVRINHSKRKEGLRLYSDWVVWDTLVSLKRRGQGRGIQENNTIRMRIAGKRNAKLFPIGQAGPFFFFNLSEE